MTEGRLAPFAWMALLALMLLVLGSCSWPTEARVDDRMEADGAAVEPLAAGLPVPPPTPSPFLASAPARTRASTPTSTAIPIPTPSATTTLTSTPAPTRSPAPTATPTVSAQALASRLRFTMPIEGARVPDRLNLAPGAPREYRSGIHEGVDFGFNAAGVPVRTGNRVVAAGDGVVVRADVDYREPSHREMDQILARTQQLGTTTPGDLDVLRCRQVWIDHGEGVVTRYAHLNGVAAGIAPGVRVSRGQLIGYVGSSGDPEYWGGLDPHLHFEIRLGEGYLGQGLSPARALQLYVQALAAPN